MADKLLPSRVVGVNPGAVGCIIDWLHSERGKILVSALDTALHILGLEPRFPNAPNSMLPRSSSSTTVFSVSRAEWAVWTALAAHLLGLKVADQLIEMVMATVHFGVSKPVTYTDENLEDLFRFPNWYVVDKLVHAYEWVKPNPYYMVLPGELDMAELAKRIREYGTCEGEPLTLDASAPFDLTAEVCIIFWLWASLRNCTHAYLKRIDELLRECETPQQAAAMAESIITEEELTQILVQAGITVQDFVQLALFFLVNCPAGTISVRFFEKFPKAFDIIRDLKNARELRMEPSVYDTADVKPAMLAIIQDLRRHWSPYQPSLPSATVLHHLSEHSFSPIEYEMEIVTKDIARLLLMWTDSPVGRITDAKLRSEAYKQETGLTPPPGNTFAEQVFHAFKGRKGRADFPKHWLAWDAAAVAVFGKDFSRAFLLLVAVCCTVLPAAVAAGMCTMEELFNFRSKAYQDRYKISGLICDISASSQSPRASRFQEKQENEMVLYLLQDIFISLLPVPVILPLETKLEAMTCDDKLHEPQVILEHEQTSMETEQVNVETEQVYEAEVPASDYDWLLTLPRRQPATTRTNELSHYVAGDPFPFIYCVKYPALVDGKRKKERKEKNEYSFYPIAKHRRPRTIVN